MKLHKPPELTNNDGNFEISHFHTGDIRHSLIEQVVLLSFEFPNFFRLKQFSLEIGFCGPITVIAFWNHERDFHPSFLFKVFWIVNILFMLLFCLSVACDNDFSFCCCRKSSSDVVSSILVKFFVIL